MRFICIIVIIVLISACSTPRGTEARRVKALDAVAVQDYQTAAAMVNEIYGGEDDQAPDKEKHKLLWYMQRGQLSYLQHDFQATERYLSRAGELVDERRAINVGGAAGSAIANETARAYAGEGFEHTQIDLIRSINLLQQAQILEGVYQPPYPVTADPEGTLNGPGIINAGMTAEKYYENARNVARRMTLNQLKETEDAAGRRRYDKDPFAMLYTGALVMAMPAPTDTDRQLANVLLKKSFEAYPEDIDDYAGDRNFEFELKKIPPFTEVLMARNGLVYLPDVYENKKELDWKDNHGSILIIQQHGFVARPKTLDIRMVSAVGARSNKRSFHVGGVAFYAKGPDTRAIENWTSLTLPGDVVQDVFGSGLKVMGFAMPVHEPDQPIPQTSVVSVVDDMGQTQLQQQLEVASDTDAYARATLKDEQPALFIKTFTRAAAKQVAAHIAAEEAKKEDPLGGLFVGLIGSAAATMTEVADTRSWWLLPNHISATLIDVPAGEYRLHLEHGNGSRDLGMVTVSPKRLAIVPARTW